MPITSNNGGSGFNRFLNTEADRVKFKAFQRLNLIGLKCVEEARRNRGYTDRTGNLRSSTGYAIIDQGKVVTISSFEPVSQTAGEGAKSGKGLIDQVASKNQSGLLLVVVAGMEYAVYVEALGKNVLDSAVTLAHNLAKQLLK
jgi:hypothetical protein